MSDDSPANRRRLDRVLDPGFLSGLTDLPLPELRSRRRDAEQEEIDCSYLRRLLQGRIDLVAAELARRTSSEGSERGSMVHELSDVFADPSRARAATGNRTRHVTVEPSQSDQHRRAVDALIDDIDLADPSARSDDELTGALSVYRDAERKISAERKAVQAVMDAASAEVGRRYRDGTATADQTLNEN